MCISTRDISHTNYTNYTSKLKERENFKTCFSNYFLICGFLAKRKQILKEKSSEVQQFSVGSWMTCWIDKKKVFLCAFLFCFICHVASQIGLPILFDTPVSNSIDTKIWKREIDLQFSDIWFTKTAKKVLLFFHLHDLTFLGCNHIKGFSCHQ